MPDDAEVARVARVLAGAYLDWYVVRYGHAGETWLVERYYETLSDHSRDIYLALARAVIADRGRADEPTAVVVTDDGEG